MTKKQVHYEEYDGESIVDLGRDIAEMFNDAPDIPTDSYGIMQGKFRVSVIWCSEDDCDCTGFQHRYTCPHHVMCY